MIVAIDGTSAAGKGTLAANLVKRFDFAYLDTGALFRAVGQILLKAGENPEDKEKAVQAAESLSPENILSLQKDPSIRTEECGSAASKVAAIPEVRQILLTFQRRFALNPVKEDGTPAAGAVLDGRDIGTVVCPDAQMKVFLSASAEVRAQRRLKELQLRGLCVIYEDILSEIQARDKRDSERKTAPLKPATDALIIDTSDMTADEVYARVVRYMEGRK